MRNLMKINIKNELDFVKEVMDITLAHKNTLYLPEKTKRDYEACYNRLVSKSPSKESLTQNKQILTSAAETKSKNTWYKRRAAIKYACLKHLILFSEKQKAILVSLNDTSIDENHRLELKRAWIEQIQMAKQYTALLKDIPDHCPIANDQRKKRTSKRQHMKQLESDWRQQILNEAIEKWRLPICILAVAGCRPAELKKGVYLEVKDHRLVCKINSAKVKDGEITVRQIFESGEKVKNKKVTYHAGQEFRELHYDLGLYPMVDALAEKIVSCITIKIDNTSSLTSAVRAIAKKLWPKRKKSITSYCFRHALGSDMKNSGMDPDDISIALGHAVSNTKSFYGQAQLSGNGHIPSKVIGARPVKPSKQAPPPANKTKTKPTPA